jgi:hypothetical protein
VCAQLDRLRGYPYRARQVAMNAAKHQLRAQNLKLTQMSYREICDRRNTSPNIAKRRSSQAGAAISGLALFRSCVP